MLAGLLAFRHDKEKSHTDRLYSPRHNADLGDCGNQALSGKHGHTSAWSVEVDGKMTTYVGLCRVGLSDVTSKQV